METALPERRRQQMVNNIDDLPDMREGECPYCERTVLSYEEPPRCPLCACPLVEADTRPFAVPVEEPSASEER